MLAVGGLCVFVQGERIAAQREADALTADLERAQARQRELIVELSRAEMPDEMLRRAAVAGMVEPGPVAAIPSAPIPTAPTLSAPTLSAPTLSAPVLAAPVPSDPIPATPVSVPTPGMPARAG